MKIHKSLHLRRFFILLGQIKIVMKLFYFSENKINYTKISLSKSKNHTEQKYQNDQEI